MVPAPLSATYTPRPPRAPQGSGWGRRRRRPARPPAPPPPPGPALLQVRPGIRLQARGPVQGVPAAASSPGIQALTFPAPAALALSPALPPRLFLPCPLRPGSGGFSRLSAILSREPLLFRPRISPPPGLPPQKALPRSGLRLLFSGTSAFPRHPNPRGRGDNRHPNPSPGRAGGCGGRDDARYGRCPPCSAHPSSSAKSHLKLFWQSLGSGPSTAP